MTIQSEHEYNVTRQARQKFIAARAAGLPEKNSSRHIILAQAMRESLDGMIDELTDQMEEWERIAGHPRPRRGDVIDYAEDGKPIYEHEQQVGFDPDDYPVY